MVRVLVIAPTIGFTGDVVNERQVAMTIAQYSDTVFMIASLGISGIIKGLYRTFLNSRPSNMRILVIPFTQLPFHRLWILNFVVRTFYALLLLVIAYFLDLRINFDVIYVRNPWFASFISFSNRLSRKCFVKIAAITEEHIYTSFMKRLAEMIICSIDRHVMKRVAGVVVHSIDFAKRLVLRRQILPKKIVVLPPGITGFNIDIVKRCCPRRKRDLKDKIVAGFLGYLERWQGVDILCDIVAELNRRGYRARLKVIGDGPLRKYLVSRCVDVGVRVEITGFLPHHRALCLARRDFDVLVLPQIRSETTSSIVPLKVVEALALGIPVVVTDLPIYKRLEGKGLYTSKRTPKDFADTILKLLSNPRHCIDYEFLQKYFYEYNVSKFLKIPLRSKT